MKKTLSIFLSVLMLLSVFSVAAFAAGAPELNDVTCTFDGVELTWSASDSAVNYVIYRADGVTGELVCIDTTTETKYVDETATAGKTYTYVVTVVNADGSYTKPSFADGKTVLYVKPFCLHEEYKWVLDYKATVFADGKKHKECTICHENIGDAVIPQLRTATPAIKALANRASGVVVSWEVVDGASSYYVYRRGAGESWKLLKITTATTLSDTSVESGKYYRYTVRAKNAAGLSDYEPGKVIKFVASPSNVQAANTAGGIRVTWNAVGGATVYRVYRKALGDADWTYLGYTKNTYYPDLKVTAGETYTYTVRAVSDKVYGYYKSEASLVRLTVPKLTTAVSNAEGISVALDKVEGAKGYQVYRKTAGTTWVLIGTVNSTRSTAYLDKSTQKGVTYTYTVRAFNGTSRSWYNVNGVSCKDVH